jgi:thiamine pyrophosphate-dependent acetolactate synthase large subunit-like protein
VISIAHGYAKATDEMMASVLHSNVGLFHGLMGIYNAWCDRMPILILGATGPVVPEKRRPWIDWIHTSKDQGAVLRNFSKWDDEPRSVHGIVQSFLRANQIAKTKPSAPVYICLDAGLQEEALTESVEIPSVTGFAPANDPSPSHNQLQEAVQLLSNAKKPLILMGRVSRSSAGWEERIRLAQSLGASVLTSIRERSAFPTDHPLHVAHPFFWLTAQAKEAVSSADCILSLDWPDLNGTLEQTFSDVTKFSGKMIHVSLDSVLHNGWSMDYFALSPVDLQIASGVDQFVSNLLPFIENSTQAKKHTPPPLKLPANLSYSQNAHQEISPHDIEVALAKVRGEELFTLAHVTIGWVGDAYHFRDPLDFLGHDGGAGLAAGPGITVGAALALKDTKRIVVSVLGDGDFVQGVSALWTAAHYKLPALFIVSNNRSNFNDEIHQQTVAKHRGRPVANRWIGQRIDDPCIDIAALAKAQGVMSEGPVTELSDLENALRRGLDAVRAGQPYLIDVHVKPEYANAPLSRGK